MTTGEPALLAPAWRDPVDAFCRHLTEERRLSPHTADNYCRDLLTTARLLAEKNLSGWGEVDSQHLRVAVATLHRRGQAGRSLQRLLSAVRSFYRYQMREQQCDHNPADTVQAPKTPAKLPKTLDADQAQSFLDHPAADTTDGRLALRDQAMLELMYSSGLRLAELVQLDIDQLDLSAASVRVTGKGGKTRDVPIGKLALKCLHAWLAVRTELAKEAAHRAVFVSMRGRRISPRSVQARFKKAAQERGLDQPLNPHMLRHSFASHLLESSGDLRAVQELLGHANLSTTQVYTHLDFQHLATVYDRTHPRAQKKKP